jgi:HEPN domain-containing protein
MKEIVAEWIAKAEGDWAVAEREWRVRKLPNFDAVCFHAQQCAEKYLKARIRDAGEDPPRNHELLPLLDRAAALEPAWEPFRPDMAVLTEYAVKFRYPGEAATKDDARACIQALRRFRSAAREAFGLV